MKPSALSALGACVVGLALSVVPIFFAGTAVLLVPIAAATGWSRGQVSSFISSGLVGLAVGAAIVGKLINVFGPRRVILCGVVAFPLSLVVFSFAPTIGVAIVLAAFVGLAGAGVSQFSYVTLLPLFFERRLGVSLGVAMLGMGLGLALVPMLLQYLEPMFDWRSIYRILAAIVFVTSLLTVSLFLHEPARAVTAGRSGVSESATTASHGITVREALASRIFWQLGLATFLATTVISGLGIHLTALMTDRGYSPLQAAAIFSVWGIGGALSRVGGGIVLDYFSARWIGAVFLIGASLGAVLLASGVTGVIVVCAVFVLAAANGMENDLLPYMTRQYFGLGSYSALYGLLGFAFTMGPAAGSILMGRSFDHFGGYGPTLWVVAAATLVAALLLIALGKPAETTGTRSSGSKPFAPLDFRCRAAEISHE